MNPQEALAKLDTSARALAVIIGRPVEEIKAATGAIYTALVERDQLLAEKAAAAKAAAETKP